MLFVQDEKHFKFTDMLQNSNRYEAHFLLDEITEYICRYVVYGSFYLISYSIVLLLLHVTLTMWFPLRLGKLDKPISAFALCCVSTRELCIYD